ncbi:MAG: hypothetical protein AAGI53_11225 [Planctomycetota bacterium]
MGSLPVKAQTASGLSRFLDLERTTCQRLVSGISESATQVRLVAQLPGAQGLRMVANSIRAQGADTTSALASIEDYDAVVTRLAGSQSKLIRRINAPGASAEPQVTPDQNATRVLFESAAAFTGRSSDLWVAAHVFTPTERADRVRQGRVHGLLGHRSARNAVPLTVHVFATNDPTHEDGIGFQPVRAERDDGVLEEFSTSPAPIVRSKTPGVSVVQSIDRDPDAPLDDPIDVMFALDGQTAHPAVLDRRCEEVWSLVNFPVRRMLFDVYLHRELARTCIAELDHHLWRPDFESEDGERWQTRFPSNPGLQMLPRGKEGVATDAWDRYPDLLSVLFEHHEAEADDYVGFRCDVAFPVWRTGYRINLDFDSSER